MSGSFPYSSLKEVQSWARTKLKTRPDFVIGDDYLRRWWVIPRSKDGLNVYLHEILHSDDDRALHDHPWDNTSWVIEGEYTEITPEGEFAREAGCVVSRKATDRHRLVIPEAGRAVSLFVTGPVIREWGFHCPQGWRHWRDFVDDRDTGKIGRGCGE